MRKPKFSQMDLVQPLILGNHKKGNKTVMVMGQEISGTSAASAIIDALGIKMDESEDGHFERALFKKEPDVYGPSIGTRIRKLNKEEDNWGFKVLPPHVKRMIDITRNPHLIAVFRDPVAISQRLKTIYKERNPEDLLNECLTINEFLFSTCKEADCPVLLLSFERLKSDTLKTINDICHFLSISPSDKLIKKAFNRVGDSGYLIQHNA